MKILRPLAVQMLLAAITVALLVGADRVTGRLVPALVLGRQLYPPGSKITVRTPEFTYTARINGEGFRDRDFGAPEAGRLRVIAIGDSFTFGWGVSIKNTWVKRLERELGSRGMAIEIANLGKPGSGPAEYAAVAQAAVGVLRPNLLLIAVQQTDDLQQAILDPVFLGLLKGLAHATLATRVEGLLRRAFPNFLLLLSGETVESPNWESTVERILASASDGERKNFGKLDPEVQHLFLDGALNPGLLVLTLKAPDYYVEIADPAAPRVVQRQHAMVEELEAIKHAAASANARVIVVSVPNRVYVSESDVANVKRLGFETRPGIADWSQPDDVIRQVAARAGLRSIFVTDNFRRACRQKRCYFTFDDHLNDTGHQVFADLVAGALEGVLRDSKGLP